MIAYFPRATKPQIHIVHHMFERSMEMVFFFDSLSPEEVCNFLKKQVPSISCSTLEKIKEHKIDGEVFVVLNDEYL